MNMTNKPMQIKDVIPKNLSWLASILSKIMRLPELQILLNSVPSNLDPLDTIEYMMKAHGNTLIVSDDERNLIPKTGPVIIVANHPHGILDGIGLTYLMLSIRNDMKVFANAIVSSITPPPFKSLYLDVDLYSNNYLENTNVAEEAEKFLNSNGALYLFPSGIVSHWHWTKWKVTDPVWSNSAAWLARKTNATIIPIYIHGTNSWYFQLAGFISKNLRTVLLGQQYFAQKKMDLKIKIGQPIAYDELKKQGSIPEQTQYIRNKTFLLGALE